MIRALILLVVLLLSVPAWAQEEEAGDGPIKVSSGGGGNCSACTLRQAGVSAQGFSGSSETATITGATAGDGFKVGAVVFSATATGFAIQVGPTAGFPSGAVTCTLDSAVTAANGISIVSATCPNTAAGALTCQSSWTGSTAGGAILCEEWQGIATTSPNDGGTAAANVAGPGTLGCGTFSTSIANDMVWHFYYTGASVVPTAGSGFTLVTSGAQSNALWSESQIKAVAGSVTPTYVTGSGAFNNYFACGAVS